MENRHHADNVRWFPAIMREVRGYITYNRVHHNDIPSKFKIWEVAEEDVQMVPARYKPSIMVNFIATFITTGDLPIDKPRTRTGYVTDGEYMEGEMSITFEEVLKGEDRND